MTKVNVFKTKIIKDNMGNRISINVHPDFYNYMERERKKLKRKGVNCASQENLTKMIAKRLSSTQSRRGLGLMKNGRDYRKKR